MKKSYLLGAVCALSLVFSITAHAAYVETFDADAADWNYGYGTSFTIGTTTWNNTGGNPDGHISGAANNLYAIWTYTTVPYGDVTGLTMTIDSMITGDATGTAQFYVCKSGSCYIDGTFDISSDTSWTTHTTVLNSANFSIWDSATLTLAQVLAAPDDIGIFFGGAVATGSGSVMVDNFGTVVPIPAAVWLFGSGLLGLVGIARRKKA